MFRNIPLEGVVQSEHVRPPSSKVGFSKTVDPNGQDCSRWALVFPVVGSIEDAVQRRLPLVQSGQAEKLADEERMSRGSC